MEAWNGGTLAAADGWIVAARSASVVSASARRRDHAVIVRPPRHRPGAPGTATRPRRPVRTRARLRAPTTPPRARCPPRDRPSRSTSQIRPRSARRRTSEDGRRRRRAGPRSAGSTAPTSSLPSAAAEPAVAAARPLRGGSAHLRPSGRAPRRSHPAVRCRTHRPASRPQCGRHERRYASSSALRLIDERRDEVGREALGQVVERCQGRRGRFRGRPSPRAVPDRDGARARARRCRHPPRLPSSSPRAPRHALPRGT